jgi:hypothetical protein
MAGDDDVRSTPRDGGTAPLFHTVTEDGMVRLRRLPRGTPIHQPARESRRPRSIGAAPVTPVVIADSTESGSTPFTHLPANEAIEPTAVVSAPSSVPKARSESKNTLPSRRAPIGLSPHTASLARIVLISAMTGAFFASLVLVVGYLLLFHGR